MMTSKNLTQIIDNIHRKIKRLERNQNYSNYTGGVSRIVFADLPTPNTNGGRIFYVQDGRKAGESAGNGTGVYAVESINGGVAAWVRMDDMTQLVQV